MGGSVGASMYEEDVEEEMLEEDIAEESFEEDVDDASLSLDAGSSSLGAGALPLPAAGLSPASLSPGGSVLDRHRRQRLSPLETSLASLDEAISPSAYKSALAGFDLAESIERP